MFNLNSRKRGCDTMMSSGLQDPFPNKKAALSLESSFDFGGFGDLGDIGDISDVVAPLSEERNRGAGGQQQQQELGGLGNSWATNLMNGSIDSAFKTVAPRDDRELLKLLQTDISKPTSAQTTKQQPQQHQTVARMVSHELLGRQNPTETTRQKQQLLLQQQQQKQKQKQQQQQQQQQRNSLLLQEGGRGRNENRVQFLSRSVPEAAVLIEMLAHANDDIFGPPGDFIN